MVAAGVANAAAASLNDGISMPSTLLDQFRTISDEESAAVFETDNRPGHAIAAQGDEHDGNDQPGVAHAPHGWMATASGRSDQNCR